MRVVVAPVLVDDRICRRVAAIESLLEVEEWVGAWWEPSCVSLTQVSSAASTAPEVLRARGLSEVDIEAVSAPMRSLEFEALMRGTDPHRPADMRFEDEPVLRAAPAVKKLCPGNSRFRRHAPRAAMPAVTSSPSVAKRPDRTAPAAP